VKKIFGAKAFKGKVVDFRPTGEFYFSLGLKSYQRNDLLNAKKYLRRACQLDPLEPDYAFQYAIVLSELGQFEESNRVLHKILQDMDGNFYECHYLLANNFACLGMEREALHHANLYVKLDPEGEFVDDALDIIDFFSGDTDWKEEPSDGPEGEIARLQEEGRNELEEGNIPLAAEKFRQLIRDFPDYLPAYNNLALLYFYMGLPEEAKVLTEQVLEKDPGNIHALCNLAMFNHYEGKDSGPLSEWMDKIHPLSPEYQYKLGITFAILGKYEQSYRWLKKAGKRIPPNDPSYYYWFAIASYYTGREKKAEELWEKLVQIDPNKEGMEPWRK
jgi:Tetratricopeptide repeat.